MKFGVVIFPGSNCDQDMIYVLNKIMGQEVVELWHKDHDLKNVDCVVLPGGFSYGDYLRSGAIARFSPIMNEVIDFAGKGGYVLGALLHNESRKFICKNVNIKAQTNNTLITSKVPMDRALKIPIAHGEGRFYANEATMKELNANDQILFRYCDENGNITPEANPNGALENIAGICNAGRNVFGMMPHPERAADAELSNKDGKWLFESLISLVHA
jgi:phosphoribosylformylglycinamidine synthase